MPWLWWSSALLGRVESKWDNNGVEEEGWRWKRRGGEGRGGEGRGGEGRGGEGRGGEGRGGEGRGGEGRGGEGRGGEGRGGEGRGGEGRGGEGRGGKRRGGRWVFPKTYFPPLLAWGMLHENIIKAAHRTTPPSLYIENVSKLLLVNLEGRVQSGKGRREALKLPAVPERKLLIKMQPSRCERRTFPCTVGGVWRGVCEVREVCGGECVR